MSLAKFWREILRFTQDDNIAEPLTIHHPELYSIDLAAHIVGGWVALMYQTM